MLMSKKLKPSSARFHLAVYSAFVYSENARMTSPTFSNTPVSISSSQTLLTGTELYVEMVQLST